MKKLEKRLNYTFRDIKLLETALTHSSYTGEKNLPRTECNERLEFLGDTVLETIIREEIFRRFPEAEEGFMTKVKSDIVRSHTLADVGRKLELGNFMKLGKGEAKSGSGNRDSILENAVEAVIGAVFLEAGYEEARGVVLRIMSDVIDRGARGELDEDYKSVLQRIVQSSRNHSKVKYCIVEESGRSHDRTFVVEVRIDDDVYGCGEGKSKKQAENRAAKQALEKF